MSKVNLFGIIGGGLTLFLVGVSLFFPWWRLTAGENIVVVDVSPVATGLSLLGKALTIPLIAALNLSSLLSFLACGIVMLAYSFLPSKSYSKDLLNFAYLTPLLGVIFLVGGVFATVSAVNGYLGLSIPVLGSTVGTLPSSLTQNLTVKVTFSSGFLWPFGFAIVSSVLCVIARLYHRRLLKA